MNVTTTNMSIKEINNDFNKNISLVDNVSQVINNTTGENLDVTQEILINEPQDFNDGIIPNLEPLSFVTERNLKLRANTNLDSYSSHKYSEIKYQNFLILPVDRTINFVNLIKLSALSNTSVDILDDLGNIIKTIPDINKHLFHSSILKHIILNTNNKFTDRELENYVLLPQNQVPLKISNNIIKIQDSINLDYFLITLSNIKQENVLIQEKKTGLSRNYKFVISLRFNIDNTKTFPVQFPQVNTNFNSTSILSEPFKIIAYIKSIGIDVEKKLKEGELTKMFIYI